MFTRTNIMLIYYLTHELNIINNINNINYMIIIK